MAAPGRIDRLLSPRTSRVLVAVLAILVLALSFMPRPERVLGSLAASDKIGHFIAYAVLGFFASRAIDRRGPLSFAAAVAACTVFGGIIEMMQPIAGRRMELADLILDCAGATIGATLTALLARSARGRNDRKPREDELARRPTAGRDPRSPRT